MTIEKLIVQATTLRFLLTGHYVGWKMKSVWRGYFVSDTGITWCYIQTIVQWYFHLVKLWVLPTSFSFHPTCWNVRCYYLSIHQTSNTHQGPLLLTLISAWISNHMPSKVYNKITYPFSNFSRYTRWNLEIDSNLIPHLIMDVITYPWWN